MEAKEKAYDLVVEKYFSICKKGTQDSFKERFEETKYYAKQCALIAVEEIIKSPYVGISDTEYWQEVKSEIEKM